MNRAEERFYQIAAQEVAEKRFSQGIMAKALVESRGQEKETILSYIKLRVQQLADEENRRLRHEQVIASNRASEAKRAALSACAEINSGLILGIECNSIRAKRCA